MKSMGPGVIMLLAACLLSVMSMEVYPRQPFTDSVVERLVSHSSYGQARDHISQRLKGLMLNDEVPRLYYSNRMSFVYLRLRNVDSSMFFARQSLGLSRSSDDSSLVSDAWRMAAYAYNNTGLLDSALYYTSRLLEYARRNKDKKLEKNALTSLATILSQNKRYDEALKYHLEVHRMNETLKDSLQTSVSLYNVGLSYLNLGRTDSCLHYLGRSLELSERNRQHDLVVYNYGTMADCYLAMNDDEQWYKCLMLANRKAEEIGNIQFIAMGYSNMTQHFLGKNNLAEAKRYGQLALEMLDRAPYPVLRLKVDSMMYVASKRTGDFRKALEYFESFLELKDKITGTRQADQLNRLMVTLEVREKDLIIARQHIEIMVHQKNQQRMVMFLVVTLLLLSGAMVYIVVNRRFKGLLYRKEMESDRQRRETKEYLEWRLSVEKEQEGDESPGIPMENQVLLPGKSPGVKLLFAELREKFESQKLYLDPELTLDMVVKYMGTNRKYLYQAISKNSDSNFRSFVNRYRIDEAKQIIERKVRAKERIQMTELYSSSGFNNEVSFYRVFKSLTGLTPKEYESAIRAEIKKGT